MPDRGSRAVGAAVISCLIAGSILSGCSPFSSRARSTTPVVVSNANLCSSVHRLGLLIVQRQPGDAARRFHFGPRVFADDSGAAGRVAVAMCELPRLPAGIHCPPALAVSYRVYFGHRVNFHPVGLGTGSAELYNSVTFNPTGCQVLRGLGQPRWIARHQSLYRVLGSAMTAWNGLSSHSRLLLQRASASTFAGEP